MHAWTILVFGASSGFPSFGSRRQGSVYFNDIMPYIVPYLK